MIEPADTTATVDPTTLPATPLAGARTDSGSDASLPVEQGTLLVSLDTELAWGHFDHPRGTRDRLFSSDGSAERAAVHRLLAMFHEYDVRATWSVVGHLFHEGWEARTDDPILTWQGRYDSFAEIYGTRNPLWYGADIVDAILAYSPHQEIGIHGYTHRTMGEEDMSDAEVRDELEAWQRVATRKGVRGRSMTFPRNRVGHLSVLADRDIWSYRGHTALPRVSRVPVLGKVLNRIDLVVQLYPPRVQPLPEAADRPMNFEGSFWLFGMNRSLERILDAVGLSLARMRRVRRAVRRAAACGQVLHLWAHPWEFRTEADFAKLAYVLDEVSAQRAAGKLRSMTMMGLAEELGSARLTAQGVE